MSSSSRDDVVGFGSGRISREHWLEDFASERAGTGILASPLVRRSREMLYRALNLRTTVVVAGAGLTAPRFGGWGQLVEKMFRYAKASFARYAKQCPIELTHIRDTFTSTRLVDARHYLWILRKVQQHLETLCGEPPPRRGRVRTFHEALGRLYSPSRAQSDKALPVLNRVLELPLHRFATTNYDAEIECELARKQGHNRVAFAKFLEGPRSSSEFTDPGFTPHRSYVAQLAEFAVATRHADQNLVFHLHGRFDDPGSLIATETDYRRFYLLPEGDAGQMFRQSAQLLLTSNPILFIGFGLQDPDFMRTLEFLRAADEPFGEERAVFALMPTDELEDAFFLRPSFEGGNPPTENPKSPIVLAIDYFWVRYGINIIPYQRNTGDDRTKKCAEAITSIADDFKAWRTNWQLKPKFRAPPRTHGNQSLLAHPDTAPREGETLVIGESAVRRDMTCIADWLRVEDASQRQIIGATEESSQKGERADAGELPSVIVILGPGGCGKSYRAHQLRNAFVKGARQFSKFDRYFFWSTYYADDWLTGVDALLDFLGASQDGRSRLDRLRSALGDPQRRALVVFDGFERVLMQAGVEKRGMAPAADGFASQPYAPEHQQPLQASERGRAYSTSVSEFLRIIAGAQSSTVILTSRLWPQPLSASDGDGVAPAVRAGAVRLLRVVPLTASDIEEGTSGHFGQDRVCANRICSLLNGHAYTLRLAHWLIKESEIGSAVCAELEWTPPDGRTGKIIDLCIEAVGKAAAKASPSGADAVRRLVEHLAVFMSPIHKAVWNTCLEQSLIPNDGERQNVQSKLIESGLIDSVHIQGDDRSGTEVELTGYTLHPIVRGHVFHRLHGSKSQEMPNFTLSGVTTGTAAVDPGTTRGRKVVCEMYDELYKCSRDCATSASLLEAARFCRAAFSVMRSRMDATAAARWDKYSTYIERSVRLANLVKRLAPLVEPSGGKSDQAAAPHGFWDHAIQPDIRGRTVFSEHGVLHAEEFAWLINDLGLACCCEGNMYDALAVWSYGYELNRLIEFGEPGGQFTVQSQLHLAHAYLELGELMKAREYLELTEKTNQILGSDDYRARINGYVGLLEHLSGDTRAAQMRYTRALGILEDNPNSRAMSIFLRHRADLNILTGNLVEAEIDVRRSLGIAHVGDHPDLAAFCHNTLGHVRRAQRARRAARAEYEMALRESRRMGIRRLESDVLSELARLALDQREPEMAKNNAMRSLRIANECGLGLRQCHALVVLGLATDMGGNRSLAIEYLRVARRLCERAAYWLRKLEVDRRLGEWGVDPASPAVPRGEDARRCDRSP